MVVTGRAWSWVQEHGSHSARDCASKGMSVVSFRPYPLSTHSPKVVQPTLYVHDHDLIVIIYITTLDNRTLLLFSPRLVVRHATRSPWTLHVIITLHASCVGIMLL